MTIVLDQPHQIEFFKLAQICGRLKIEVEAGLSFRQPTLKIARQYYGLKTTRKARALEILTDAKARVLEGEDIYQVLDDIREVPA